jgi:hypothetical protein
MRSIVAVWMLLLTGAGAANAQSIDDVHILVEGFQVATNGGKDAPWAGLLRRRSGQRS